jgi:hypothetical protein
MSDCATKIAKNTEEMTIVNSGRSRDKLTQNMNRIIYVRTSDNKINKTPNKDGDNASGQEEDPHQ